MSMAMFAQMIDWLVAAICGIVACYAVWEIGQVWRRRRQREALQAQRFTAQKLREAFGDDYDRVWQEIEEEARRRNDA